MRRSIYRSKRRASKAWTRAIVSEIRRASQRFAVDQIHAFQQTTSYARFWNNARQSSQIAPDARLKPSTWWLGIRALHKGGGRTDSTPSRGASWYGWTPFLLDHTMSHKTTHTMAGWGFYPNPLDRPKRRRRLGTTIEPENPTGPRVNVAETAQYHLVRVFVQGFGSTFGRQMAEVLCTQDWTCKHCLPGRWPKPKEN